MEELKIQVLGRQEFCYFFHSETSTWHDVCRAVDESFVGSETLLQGFEKQFFWKGVCIIDNSCSSFLSCRISDTRTLLELLFRVPIQEKIHVKLKLPAPGITIRKFSHPLFSSFNTTSHVVVAGNGKEEQCPPTTIDCMKTQTLPTSEPLAQIEKDTRLVASHLKHWISYTIKKEYIELCLRLCAGDLVDTILLLVHMAQTPSILCQLI